MFDLLEEEEQAMQEQREDPDYAAEVWDDESEDEDVDEPNAADAEAEDHLDEDQPTGASDPPALRPRRPLGRPKSAGKVVRAPEVQGRAFTCPKCDYTSNEPKEDQDQPTQGQANASVPVNTLASLRSTTRVQQLLRALHQQPKVARILPELTTSSSQMAARPRQPLSILP